MSTFHIIIKHPFDVLLILLITVDVFFPKIPLGSSSFLTDLIISCFFIAPILTSFLLRGYYRKNIFKLYLCLVVLHFISTLHGYFALGVSTHPADIWNFVNEFKYLFIICVGSLCTFNVISGFFDKFINFGSYLMIIICLLEFFNPIGIASILGNYFSSELHASGMTDGSHRIIATGTDPNVGAAIVAFFLLYRFCRYLHYREFQDLLFSVLLLVCVLLTSSRTVFAGVSCVMALFVLTHKGIKVSAKIWILIFIVATSVVLLPHFAYLIEGFTTFFSDEGNHSFNKRLMVWQYLFEKIKLSPIIGWGVAESIIDGFPVDGEYIFTLFRYGAVGLILYLLINIKLVLFPPKSYLSDTKLIFFKDYLTLIFLMSLFVMVTNNFYLGKQLFQIYIAILSFFYCGLYSKDKKLYTSQ